MQYRYKDYIRTVEDFPKKGETISVPPYTFIIQSTKGNRIETVKVEVGAGTDRD